MDLLIADATVVDGTEPRPPSARTIDGRGLIFAPGFIDVHNHSDLSPFVLPEIPSTLRQGVTTVVVGNCGSSPFPLSSWGEALSLAYTDPDARSRPAWAGW